MFGKKNFNDILKDFDKMMSHYNEIMENSHKTNETKKTYESPDGNYRITSHVRVFDLSDLLGNSEKMTKQDELKLELTKAIENEDFENAVKIRDQIKTLEDNKEEIEKLQLDLKKSIQEQNFELSIKIRDELKKLIV
jgi:excinuclease UvrABC helicase subunit UvrB